MSDWLNRCHFGDCLETLRRMPDGIVNTCVTSPPYFGLRDYGHAGQIGLEETPEQFIAKLVEVFREVRRVLRDDGTCWVNIGDSYARNPAKGGSGPGGKNIAYSDSYSGAGGAGIPSGLKEKDLIGVPWMLAFALRADGWFLRSEVIWHKPNPMPESVTDRPTKAHEQIFLLSKSARYYFDGESIKEPATCDRMRGPALHRDTVSTNGNGGLSRRELTEDRNKRSVWSVATTPYKGAHFATFPTELIEPCVMAGAPAGGVVLDPFFGSGTTGQVAEALSRQWIGCELNPEYEPLQRERMRQPSLLLEAA